MFLLKHYSLGLFFAGFFVSCLAHDDTINLFVAIPVLKRDNQKKVIKKIQRSIKEFDPASTVYTPDVLHATIVSLGEISKKDLSQVHAAMEAYIANLNEQLFSNLVEQITLNRQRPLALYASKFSKFFVLSLSGMTDEKFDSLLAWPLKGCLDDFGIVPVGVSKTQARYFSNKKLPNTPHISLAKTKSKSRRMHPKRVERQLWKIAADHDVTHSIKAPILSATIVLYQGLPDGGVVRLKTYTLDPATVKDCHDCRPVTFMLSRNVTNDSKGVFINAM